MTRPLDRADLVAAWAETHGRPPPKGLSTRVLALSAAYQDQVRDHGGLTPRSRDRLMAILDPDSGTANTSRKGSTTACGPGTRFVREWRGEAHVVDVTGEGVLYRGETYPSLSAVARHITGAKWSGPRFFGLGRSDQKRP